MYLSGKYFNYENRLHQLPTTRGELTTFIQEGCFLLGAGFLDSGQLMHWNQEALKKQYEFQVGAATGTPISGGDFDEALVGLTGYTIISKTPTASFTDPLIVDGTNFTSLVTRNVNATTDEIDITHNTGLQRVYLNSPLWGCANLIISHNPNLVEFVSPPICSDTLDLSFNALTSFVATPWGELVQQFNISHNNLTYLDMDTVHNFDGFNISFNRLTTIDHWMRNMINNAFDASNINISNNLFSSTELDRLINVAEPHLAVPNGTWTCTGNPGRVTSASAAARASLSGRGWTINFDNPSFNIFDVSYVVTGPSTGKTVTAFFNFTATSGYDVYGAILSASNFAGNLGTDCASVGGLPYSSQNLPHQISFTQDTYDSAALSTSVEIYYVVLVYAQTGTLDGCRGQYVQLLDLI